MQRFDVCFRWRLAHEHGELMVDDIDLLLERGQGCAGLGDKRALAGYVVLRYASCLIALLGDGERLLLEGEHLAREFDLRAQLGLTNSGQDNVAGKHESRPFELPFLVDNLRVEALDET